MKKKSVLVATYIAPWPLRGHGVSIRLYPLLERLADHVDIDVVAFSEYREKLGDDPILKKFRRVAVHASPQRRPTLPERLKMVASIASPWGVPREYASYHVPEITDRLREFVGKSKYDVLLWVGYYHWQAIEGIRSSARRVVYDSMDSPSLHYERDPRHTGLAKALKPYDLWKCRRWERSLKKRTDATVYVSPVDASTAGGNALDIPNAVYPPDEPRPSVTAHSPCIGFLGNMGYAPNILGAKNLHDNIFKPLKARFPRLRLKIIGRNPAPEILALKAPDVEITGTVEDIWEHIYSVDVFVFPMTAGAGLQNKILEAMVAGKPVVTTSICAGSVGAKVGHAIICQDTDEGLQEWVTCLLSIPEMAAVIGRRGQEFVRKTFDLERIFSLYERALFGGVSMPIENDALLGVPALPLG